MYKYDLFQNRELDDVRTWYLKVAWNRATSTTFDVRYEYEDDSSAEYHSVRLGMTWRF
jgi:outer membrane receptor for Fe3+-dicitrate